MSPAYQAAVGGSAVLRQRSRRFLTVEGRGPEQILKGILSGKIPGPLDSGTGPWQSGSVAYSAVLTPKGKMITDLRVLPLPRGGFLLDLPAAGTPGVLAHFRKFINPRFATVSDRSGKLGMLTVVGPGGPDTLASALGTSLTVPGEDEVRIRLGPREAELMLLCNRDVDPVALDLILPLAILEEIRGRLEDRDARALDTNTWDVLRIEAGTPVFGVDMTDETIPVEAGIHDRAIDYEKGCYTGQEVIIRLRDRGRVNKHLRRMLLGDIQPPEPGTGLFLPLANGEEPQAHGPAPEAREGSSGGPASDRASGPPGAPPAGGDPPSDRSPEPAATSSQRAVGRITSACSSPRFGQSVALGFLKRGIEPGDRVAVGSPSGPVAVVEPLR